MPTTSKIKEIKSVRAVNGTHGQFWSFTVEMENGDKGQINRKSENALRNGIELTYTLDNTGAYTKLKEDRPAGFSGRNAPIQQSTAIIALGFAKDILVANIAASGKCQPMDGSLADKTTALAYEFDRWLKENHK